MPCFKCGTDAHLCFCFLRILCAKSASLSGHLLFRFDRVYGFGICAHGLQRLLADQAGRLLGLSGSTDSPLKKLWRALQGAEVRCMNHKQENWMLEGLTPVDSCVFILCFLPVPRGESLSARQATLRGMGPASENGYYFGLMELVSVCAR